jgi:hypothetical protein
MHIDRTVYQARALRREVLPVLRARLELVAFFVGVSALSFWASMTW